MTLAETEEAPFSASRASKIRRASWNLIDQVLSAATNVLLSFLVARTVSANEFGAFSVAFLLFSLMIGVSRALVGTPLSIRHSGESGEVRRATARAAFGTVLTVTLAASALLLLAGLIWRATLGPTLIALAVVLPFLILQDTCRMSFFAWAQPKLAALNDAIWAVLQLTFVLVLVRSGHVSAPVMVLAWGVAAAPASIVGMFQLRAVPIFGRVRAWIYETRGIVGYLLAGRSPAGAAGAASATPVSVTTPGPGVGVTLYAGACAGCSSSAGSSGSATSALSARHRSCSVLWASSPRPR